MGAVVVDLDGTLLDTRARHHAAYAAAVRALGGEPIALGPFWRAKRRGATWSWILGPQIRQEAFLDHFKGLIERADMLALDRLQRGAGASLDRLVRDGRALVLVTARRDPDALADQLRRLDIARVFKATVATEGAPKYVGVAGAGPIERWIGDTEEDVEAARAIGVPVTAVTNGIRCPFLLTRAHPDDLAPSFAVAARRLLAVR